MPFSWMKLSLFLLMALVMNGLSLQAEEPCTVCPPADCGPRIHGPIDATCCPKLEEKVEKESGWLLERDFVCIPPVRFPWMGCDGVECPKIREIWRLKKQEYEVRRYEWNWSMKKIWPCLDTDGCE